MRRRKRYGGTVPFLGNSVGRYVNLGAHTWDEFVRQAARRVTEKQLLGANDHSSSPDRDGWYGTPNLEAAVKMAASGWADGANEVAKTLDVMPAGDDVAVSWELDVRGAMPCVPAYLAGDPECMWRFSEEHRPAKRMTLVVPASYSAMIPPTQAMQYAKGVAAITRAVESSQIDVAIWSLSSGCGRSGAMQEALYAVAVRELGEPLDLAKVAFASHPSWLRRLHFAWREITQGAVNAGQASNGYATPMDITHDRAREVLGDAIDDNASALVCLPSVNECNRSGLLYDSQFDELLQRFRTTIEEALAKKEQEKSDVI